MYNDLSTPCFVVLCAVLLQMCVAFAMVEQKLGEIDRARAVFTHGSQFADPRRAAPYWQVGRGVRYRVVSC